MKLPIILIGSSNTSKTSVGKLLAQQLDLPFISLSDVSEKYFLEIEFNQKQLEEALEKDGGDGYYRYIQPFNAYAIERVLSEHQESVIELASEQSVDESVEILKQRNQLTINGVEINRFFMTHPSNKKLSKQVIYTKGKTPEEIKEEILCS